MIDWPLRFSIHGMTIGFFGEPSRPIVEAIGMPISMCVAWMSPFDSESRMAAQLAPFATVELMPYFLNSPFSCAITIGEQSVSAIMPKRRSATSGAVFVAPQLARARSRPMPPNSAAAPPTTCRRDGLHQSPCYRPCEAFSFPCRSFYRDRRFRCFSLITDGRKS